MPFEIHLFGDDKPGLTTLLAGFVSRERSRIVKRSRIVSSQNIDSQLLRIQSQGQPGPNMQDEWLELTSGVLGPNNSPIVLRFAIINALPEACSFSADNAILQKLDIYYTQNQRLLYLVENPFRLAPLKAVDAFARRIEKLLAKNWPFDAAVYFYTDIFFGYSANTPATAANSIQSLISNANNDPLTVANAICTQMGVVLDSDNRRKRIQQCLASIKNIGLIFTHGDIESEIPLLVADEMYTSRPAGWERRLIVGRPSFIYEGEYVAPNQSIKSVDLARIEPWLECELVPQVEAAVKQLGPQIYLSEAPVLSTINAAKLSLARCMLSAHWLVIAAWAIAFIELQFGLQILHRSLIQHTADPPAIVSATNAAFRNPADATIIWWFRNEIIMIPCWFIVSFVRSFGENRWTGIFATVNDSANIRFTQQHSLFSRLLAAVWQVNKSNNTRILVHHPGAVAPGKLYVLGDIRSLATGVVILITGVLAVLLPPNNQWQIALVTGILYLVGLLTSFMLDKSNA